MEIFVNTAALSSAGLRKAEKLAHSAESHFNKAGSSAINAIGFEGRSIFGGQYTEIGKCISEIAVMREKLGKYCTMLEQAPAEILQADSKNIMPNQGDILHTMLASSGILAPFLATRATGGSTKVAVKKTTWRDRLRNKANALYGGIKSTIASVKQNYKNHGWVYDAVQYGKCALRVGKGIVKIVGAVGSIATGVGIPIGIAGIISAGNDIINAAVDATYVYTDQYDMVGSTNYLKDLLVKNGGDLGEMLGNRKAGEMFGELTYTGLDVVSFLDGADKMLESYGRLNTSLTGTTGYSWVWGETTFDDVLDHEIKMTSTSGIIRNVLNWAPSSEGNLAYEAIENSVKVYKKGSSVTEKVIGIAKDY